MKSLRIAIGCLVLMAGVSFGQTTQSINFSDNGLYGGTNTTGTFNPTSTFNLNVLGSWSGFNPQGFSLWLETNTALAPFLTITGETYTQFAGPTDNGFPKAFTSTTGADSGFRTATDTVINPQTGTMDTGDLGATGAPVGQTSGTNVVFSNIQFALNNAPAGTYTLALTTLSPEGSEISDSSHVAHAVPSSTYTITVVPEPATWSLFGIGGLGTFGLTWLRARRKS